MYRMWKKITNTLAVSAAGTSTERVQGLDKIVDGKESLDKRFNQ